MTKMIVILSWAARMLQDYAYEYDIEITQIPDFATEYNLYQFLTDNYELFHLYPDAAVLGEISREIADQNV